MRCPECSGPGRSDDMDEHDEDCPRWREECDCVQCGLDPDAGWCKDCHHEQPWRCKTPVTDGFMTCWCGGQRPCRHDTEDPDWREAGLQEGRRQREAMRAHPCPTCDAPAGRNCRSPRGRNTVMHAARWELTEYAGKVRRSEYTR